MGNFNRDRSRGRDSGRRSFGGDREKPQMYKAVCANCGKDCEVPFKPNGSKPVLCRDCFREQGGSDSRSEGRSFSRSNDRSRSYDDRGNRSSGNEDVKTQLNALNAKVDTILEILSTVMNEGEEEEEDIQEPEESQTTEPETAPTEE